MKRSIALAGLMVLAAASSAAAQGRPAPQLPNQGGAVTQHSCMPGSYSVSQSPDGRSVTVLFDSLIANAPTGRPRIVRTTCRIAIPLTLPEGHSASLVSVDYRGYAQVASRQAAEIAVDYDLGRNVRLPRFHRLLTGPQDTDFSYTDRPTGYAQVAGCGRAAATAPVLNLTTSVAVSTGGQQPQAMIALDSSDQATGGGLTFRFNVQPCTRAGPGGDVSVLSGW